MEPTTETATTETPHFLIKLTGTTCSIKRYETAEACTEALTTAKGKPLLVATAEHLGDLKMDELVRIYNRTKPATEVTKFKSKADGAEKVMERLATFGTAAPRAARTPAASKEKKNIDKAASAIGRPVRHGSMFGAIVVALMKRDEDGKLVGSTIDEIRLCGKDWDRARASARLWGVWKTSGIGYKVSADGHYTIDMPGNLTEETVIKYAAEEPTETAAEADVDDTAIEAEVDVDDTAAEAAA